MLVAGASSPGEVRVDGDAIVWSESRPLEGGRVALVRHAGSGDVHEVVPQSASVRTRVHEYGGGAWALGDGQVVYCDDNRGGQIMTVAVARDGITDAPPEPRAISPETSHAANERAVRYADLHIDVHANRLFAVRERHRNGVVHNDLVAMPLSGAAVHDESFIETIAHGADFYAHPALRADGTHLAFIRWNLPAMPWNGTEVVVVNLADGQTTVVAGGPNESIVEPNWAPTGHLTFLSDRSGWWNPFRWDPASGSVDAIATLEAEIGGALWVFGNRSFTWLDEAQYVCVATAQGTDSLVMGNVDTGVVRPLDVEFTHISQVVRVSATAVAVVAGSPTAESSVYVVSLPEHDPARVVATPLRAPRPLPFGGDGAAWVSEPYPITVSVGADAVTHALVYPPRNPTVDDDAPAPLIVKIHGGPTSAARAQLDLGVQYWTSRGFCVADVNYRGSTGYGRAYRNALDGAWGVADVADCVAVAKHLAATNVVDPERLGIRGGSAGGFTTLAAMAFHDTFTAGSSSYGIADLAVLASDTHKFESRYLDTLIGPWPEAKDLYRERSPLFHLDGLSCPVAILQGDEDAVVPPNQADAIVAALRERGVPHAVVHFPDEGHGFRNAPNIVRALEGELWFFAKAFGLALDEPITPLEGAGL